MSNAIDLQDYIIRANITIEPRGGGEIVELCETNVIAEHVAATPDSISQHVGELYEDLEHFAFETIAELATALTDNMPKKFMPTLKDTEGEPLAAVNDTKEDAEAWEQLRNNPTFARVIRRSWRRKNEDGDGNNFYRGLMNLFFAMEQGIVTLKGEGSLDTFLDFLADGWNVLSELPKAKEAPQSVILQNMKEPPRDKAKGLTQADLRKAAALQMSPTLTKTAMFAQDMPGKDDPEAIGDSFATALVDLAMATDNHEIAFKTSEAAAMFYGLLCLAMMGAGIEPQIEEATAH